MKKILSIVLLVSIAFFVATIQIAPALAEHQGHEASDENNEFHQIMFRVHLTGNQQVAPVATDAFGMATIKLVDNGTAIAFRVIACDIVNVTASHIHVGAAGSNGPVIIPFFGNQPLFSSPHGCKILAEGTRSEADLNTKASPSIMSWNDFVKALLAGNTYINVHTKTHPIGEIRGQLVHPDKNDQGDE